MAVVYGSTIAGQRQRPGPEHRLQAGEVAAGFCPKEPLDVPGGLSSLPPGQVGKASASLAKGVHSRRREPWPPFWQQFWASARGQFVHDSSACSCLSAGDGYYKAIGFAAIAVNFSRVDLAAVRLIVCNQLLRRCRLASFGGSDIKSSSRLQQERHKSPRLQRRFRLPICLTGRASRSIAVWDDSRAHDAIFPMELAEGIFVRRSRVLRVGMGDRTGNRDARPARGC